jgi:hypothetical protein
LVVHRFIFEFHVLTKQFHSEKLANTERHLDVSKGYSQKADDKTDELKQLNKSIFRPVITWNKDSKRAAQEAKVQARYEEEREEREKAMMDIRDTQNRIGRAQTYGRADNDEELLGRGKQRSEGALSARKEQRKRYQFDATASDDEVEDELDDNLDEIGEAAKRLKALGMTMGDELDKQVQRIKRIEEKTVDVDGRIYRNTERVSEFLTALILRRSLTTLPFLSSAQKDQVNIQWCSTSIPQVLFQLGHCVPSLLLVKWTPLHQDESHSLKHRKALERFNI